jgi:hypothetical protein
VEKNKKGWVKYSCGCDNVINSKRNLDITYNVCEEKFKEYQ